MATKASKSQTGLEFILANIVIATILGWQISRSLLTTDKGINDNWTSKSPNRTPDSVNPSAAKAVFSGVGSGSKSDLSALAVLVADLANLDGTCEKSFKTNDLTKAPPLRSIRNSLQIKGSRCLRKSNVKIQNSSNGFEATIFFVNDQEFQTDLIQLQAGENKIQIDWTAPNGALLHKMIFVDYQAQL